MTTGPDRNSLIARDGALGSADRTERTAPPPETHRHRVEHRDRKLPVDLGLLR